jgi:MoaA/NifB/PqqE/SkfB family radical SAM enzyme
MNNTILKIENSNIVNASDSIINSNTFNSKIISGIPLFFLRINMRLRLLRLIATGYNNPIDWIKALKHLISLRKHVLGTPKIKKLAKVNDKYYMGIYAPAWFSEGFDQFIYSNLNDFKSLKKKVHRFNMVFISVTNKCPLQCEHCYDWNNIKDERKTYPINLLPIVEKLQELGVGHIQFLGGEPLLEYKKIIEVVKSRKSDSDFWITTSGFSLSESKANQLKAAGVSGVIISLDHYIPEKHNKFRNHNEAFHWVKLAVKNAINAKLIVALSICVTKEFMSDYSLEKYMQTAKALGVMFVQFLEPKPVGHYKSKDVLLNNNHIAELEKFFLTYNFKSKYKDFPIIIYPGYHQRRQGCMLSGKKSIYIDTEGNINPCPFCHKSYGKFLDHGLNLKLERLVSHGCVS